MKKILLLSILAINYLSTAQTKRTITFDYQNKKLNVANESIKTGEYYILDFKGVNTSFIQIKIEDESFFLVSDIPEALKLILPSVNSSGDFKNKSFLNDSGIKETDIKNEYDKIYLKAKAFRKKLDFIKKEFSSLYKYTIDKTTYLNETQIKSKANTSINKILLEYEAKNKDGTLINKKIINYNKLTVKQKTEKQSELLAEIANSINYIKSSSEFFKNSVEKSRTAKSVYENSLIEYLSDLSRDAEEINKSNHLNYLKFIIRASKMTTTYQSKKPLNSKKDILETKITMINTVTKDTIHKETLKFYTYGKGAKFDFSTGFFYNNIVQKSYYLKERDNDDTKNDVLEENGDDFDIAIGALAHISWQLSENMRGGFSLGIGVSPLDSNPRYLFGLSSLIGKENLIGINGGVSLARINVLSDSVSKDNVGSYVESSVTAVPTFKKSEWGFYLGLTYNLTRKKKK